MPIEKSRSAKVVPIHGRKPRRAKPGPRKRPGVHADNVRAAILETARELYARGGYDGVTMGAVAHQLGIKAPSLYHHFPSKDAIFRELQRQTFVLLHAEQGAPVEEAWEALRQYFLRYYRFSKEKPDYFSLLFADPSTPQFGWLELAADVMQSQIETAHRRVRRCMDEGLLPPTTDVAHVSNILWSAVHGVAMLRVLSHPAEYQFDTLAVDTLDTVLNGLRHPLPKAGKSRQPRR